MSQASRGGCSGNEWLSHLVEMSLKVVRVTSLTFTVRPPAYGSEGFRRLRRERTRVDGSCNETFGKCRVKEVLKHLGATPVWPRRLFHFWQFQPAKGSLTVSTQLQQALSRTFLFLLLWLRRLLQAQTFCRRYNARCCHNRVGDEALNHAFWDPGYHAFNKQQDLELASILR